MSTHYYGLIPGPNIYLEVQMLATIISSFIFGVVLSLSTSCFQLVYRKCRQKSDQTSTRRDYFLLAYITIMTSMSLVYLIVDIYTIRSFIFNPPGIYESEFFMLRRGGRLVFITLAIWGGDGFMVRFFDDFCP